MITQGPDGELSHEGVFVLSKPDLPSAWKDGDLPMELTVAYSLGNGDSQVILPTEQMTLWQAQQKVRDTVLRHNPQEDLSPRHTDSRSMKLKFYITVNTDDADEQKSIPEVVPQWKPDQVQAMFDSEPPQITKAELFTEINRIATPQWLAENGMSGRNTLKKCSVASLIEKYVAMCVLHVVAVCSLG